MDGNGLAQDKWASDELVKSANDRFVFPDVQQRDELLGDSRSPWVIDPPLVVRRRVPIGGDQMCGSGVIGGSQEHCLPATGKFAGTLKNSLIRVEVLDRLSFSGRGVEGEKAADQVHSRNLRSSSGQMLTGPFPALMCGEHSLGRNGCARAHSRIVHGSDAHARRVRTTVGYG